MSKPRIGLFVTCLVDVFRPSIGFCTVKLLESAGCEVVVPAQSCCGQPAYNAGDRTSARDIALLHMQAFSDCSYIVAPSGSCAGMMARHYPALFADDPDLLTKAKEFANKCHELTSFLVDVMGMSTIAAQCERTITYHDSCSGLRELGIAAQPRSLLRHVEGLRLNECKESDVCCGFGGAFAVKYSEISDAIVTQKINNIEASGADLLVAGDLGCLMNMAGKLARQGKNIEVRHIAEVLAGDFTTPAIGRPQNVPQHTQHDTQHDTQKVRP
jgi:L-lactate dehydrogenase complex protein LldE